MKKAIILSIFILVAMGIKAQDVSVGIKGGLNFGSQGYNFDNFSSKMKTGYHAGVFASFMFNDYVGLQPEVVYSVSKSRVDVDDLSGLTSELNYVIVPLLLKIKPIEFLELHAGPAIGFLSGYKRDGQSVKEFYRSNDVGIVFGAGVEVPFGLTGGIRYNLSLTDINDGDPELNNVTVKNRLFQIFVGFKLFDSGRS